MERYSKFVWVWFLAFLMILFGTLADTQGAGVKIYRIMPDNIGMGQIIKVNDRKFKVTKVNRDDLIQSIRIVSQNNENTQYSVSIETRPFPGEGFHGIVLEIDGFTKKSNSVSRYNGNIKTISFYPVDKKIASKLASGCNVKLEDRKHPGHKLLTRFIKHNKDSFVTLEITNVGDKAIKFMDGGMQRGFRNNQFGFIGFRHNQALKDIGSPIHFGGFARSVILKPGEMFTKKVDLAKWFDLSKKGYYEVTGLFYLEFHPEAKDGTKEFFYSVIWEDYAAAKFTFTVE